ncbi:MAG: efflux RND transporter permease subunit [Chloroflexota bacterium]
MNLTRLAVQRPILALTFLLTLVMGGVVAYSGLGLDQLPDIRPPIVTIQAVYPGAGPEDVEQQVTRKIEDAVASLSDIEELTSTSSQSASIITVRFRESVNIDIVALDVERTVNNVRRELPVEVEAPTIRKLDLNAQPIMYLALWTSGGRDATEMFRLADEQIRPRLEGLQGISSARPLGGRKPEIQVDVDPERLRALRLTIGDVSQALAAQYQSVAGGIVKTGQASSQREFGLRVEGREPEASAIRQLYVTNREGVSVQLGSIAAVEMAGAEQASIVRLNGAGALGILVTKQSEANITQAADKVLEELPRLRSQLPEDLHLDIVLDRSSFVRSSLNDVQHELGIAVLLTGVVLLAFLHTLRATLIVLLAIPACIVVTFIIMRMTDVSLNILSLLGLTTSIGILVDDSIVVLENIFRKVEQGQNPVDAAIEGRSEIGMAAIAITLVDVVVFGPIIFLTGTTGGFLRNFAVVITAATLTSLLVSFTLTPLLASRWLKAHEKRSLLSRVAGSWEPFYHWLERRYERLLGWSLRHRPVVIIGAVAMFFSSFAMVPFIGVEFVPDIDSPFITLSGELPGGSGLAAADQAALRWEQMLLNPERFPEVRSVYMLVGSGQSEAERGSRFLSAIVELSSRHDRNRTSKQVQRAALDAASEIPDLRTSIGGERAGGSGQAVQYRLYGQDIAELTRVAREAQLRLSALPELADVSNNTAVVSPEVVARVDPQRIQDFGVTTQQIGASLRISYQGIVPAKYPRADGTEIDIRVRIPESQRQSIETIQDLPLITTRGTQVTLGQVADLERREIPSRITRIGRQRVAVIGADPKGVDLGTASALAKREMEAMTWPTGMRWELAGQSKEQQDSFANLALALGGSVILMFLVLTTLYESVFYPIVILSSLPLALIGALGGLLVFHNTLNILSMIGVIALMGLVGKNAILLVDYTNQLRKQGMERNAAILKAGPARLRPIIMTSLTLILGLMPVALRLGDGGELRAPLAAVIIGGMVSSTVLTLLFVPVSYTYFDGLQRRLMGLFKSRSERGDTSVEGAPAPEPDGVGRRAAVRQRERVGTR